MKFSYSGLLSTLLLLLASCAGTSSALMQPSPGVPPAEASLPVPEVIPSPYIATPTLHERLSAYPDRIEQRKIGIRVFPQDAEIVSLSNLELVTLTPSHREHDTQWFTTNAGAIGLQSDGYITRVVPLIDGEITEVKLERADSIVQRIGELPTGFQPKSVRFSPDGRYLFTIHLGDEIAINQYRVSPFDWVRSFNVPDEAARHKGFVESFILEKRKELWISQMTTNSIHIFNLETGAYISQVKLSGSWPKLLVASPDEKKMYASCWISNSISVIDTESYREVSSFKTGPIPRGLSLSRDVSEILVTRFSDSAVDRINLSTGKTQIVHDAGPKKPYAMRHIVYDKPRGEYYITAMGASRVYRLSETGQWMGFWEVGEKPNTCDISPDGQWLVVSCRGPNNPDTGYLTRGYEYGKIYFIRLDIGEVVSWIWGRDQPTGLDISSDGQYLAFTNFLSHSLELYEFQ